MAARKRRRRRRRNSGFLLSFITFCIVIAAIITSVTVFLKVAEIQVTGTTRYDGADIVETSGIETGDNMFMINKFEVAERILNEYPYIEQIKIRRKLPDTFTFEITERVPVAYIEISGSRWIMDSNGYLLEQLSTDAKTELPKVSGCIPGEPKIGEKLALEDEDRFTALREVLTAVRRTDMGAAVARIEVDKLYDIRIIYGNRFIVSLGDATSLPKKIEMLRAVISELTDFDKGTIDVSAVKEARFKPNANIDLSEKIIEQPKVEEPAVTEKENGKSDSEKETEEEKEDASAEKSE